MRRRGAWTRPGRNPRARRRTSSEGPSMRRSCPGLLRLAVTCGESRQDTDGVPSVGESGPGSRSVAESRRLARQEGHLRRSATGRSDIVSSSQSTKGHQLQCCAVDQGAASPAARRQSEQREQPLRPPRSRPSPEEHHESFCQSRLLMGRIDGKRAGGGN